MSEDNSLERIQPRHVASPRPPVAAQASLGVPAAEEGPNLFLYWRVIRKRLLTIAGISFVLFIVTLLGTLRQTPMYRAEVLIEIQNENSTAMTLQDLFELDNVTDTYLQTQFKVLASEGLARRVIDELQLHELDEFNPPPLLSWLRPGGTRRRQEEPEDTFLSGVLPTTEVSEATYQKSLAIFSRRLQVVPVRRSRLVTLQFESEDPGISADVVNSLAASFIEQSLEARWDATQKATEWLTQQLQEMKIRLERSEEALHQYARERGLLFLEKEGGGAESIVNDRLRSLQEELTKAEADRQIQEALFHLTETREPDSIPGIGNTEVMQNLSVSLAQLKSRRAELLAVFQPEYPKVQQVQEQIDQTEQIMEEERHRGVERTRSEYQAALGREQGLRNLFKQQEERANLLSERSVQYKILKREVETDQELYEGLLQRLREAGISGGLSATNIRVVDPAVRPERPSRPNLPLNLAVGLILGISLGMGTAFLQEYLDNSLKHSEDVARFLRLPSLASIPAVDSLNGHRKDSGLLTRYTRAFVQNVDEDGGNGNAPSAPGQGPGVWYRIDRLEGTYARMTESFRNLRTSVLLSAAEHPPRSILITSADPGEGKSTIGCNLAISLAQMGRKTLVVDFDMRRPAMHRLFDLENDQGLVNYLTGQCDWQPLVRTQEDLPGLDVLVCGPVPPNPAELVAADRSLAMIREATASYDFVILDSPPLASVAEGRILSRLVEGVILVVKGGVTPREVVRRAKNALGDAGANILGVVLNKVDLRAADYHYYYHYYNYYDQGYYQSPPEEDA